MGKPFYDKANGTWKVKVKCPATGKWKSKTLGKGSEPPQHIDMDLSNAPTLKAWANLYQQRHTARRENGIKRRACVIRAFTTFAESRGWATLESITNREINEWVDARQGVDGVGASTVVADLAVLQGMFSKAVEEGRITINPVKVPARDARRRVNAERQEGDEDDDVKYYTREQERRIWALVPEMLPKYADLVTVMLATGIRVNATIQMEGAWVGDNYRIRIPRKWDKAKSGYVAHTFGKEAKQVLERRIAQHGTGRLFPEIPDVASVYHYLQALYKRNGMTDIVELGSYNHIWRHTFAVRKVEAGMLINVVQKLMGHHSLKQTLVYAKVSDHAFNQAIEQVEAILDDA